MDYLRKIYQRVRSTQILSRIGQMLNNSDPENVSVDLNENSNDVPSMTLEERQMIADSRLRFLESNLNTTPTIKLSDSELDVNTETNTRTNPQTNIQTNLRSKSAFKTNANYRSDQIIRDWCN